MNNKANLKKRNGWTKIYEVKIGWEGKGKLCIAQLITFILRFCSCQVFMTVVPEQNLAIQEQIRLV